jgi:hypothetical protein
MVTEDNDKRTEIELAVLANDMGYVKAKLDSIDTKVSSHYVSKEEFEPIKKIVYGLVSLILVAVVGAVVSLVLG